MTGGHGYGIIPQGSHDIRGVVGGSYPMQGPSEKSLGATCQPGNYANIAPRHPILADLHAVLCHCISEAQPRVEAICAPLQAAKIVSPAAGKTPAGVCHQSIGLWV